MKSIFCSLFSLVVFPINFAFATTAEVPGFHAPQTEAEKALDKIIHTEEIYPVKELQDVLAWLEGKQVPRSAIYESFFTRNYLEKWSKAQTIVLARCRKNNPPEDQTRCRPYVLTCNYVIDPNLQYHTLESSEQKASVVLDSPELAESGSGVYYMTKESNQWKIDSTECVRPNWEQEK